MRARFRSWALLFALSASALAAVGPAGAATSRSDYEQPVWFEWETAELDVIIVPPNHGQLYNGEGVFGGEGPGELTPFNSYLRAIERSIAGWNRAVAQFAAEWLRQGLRTRVYVAGRDLVPSEALLDPEIVVVTDETKGSILGLALSTRPCIVDNSKLMITSFTYEDMYNINAQEYGHCLGLQHVLGPGQDDVIAHDVMNGVYADTPGAAGNHLHCVSNLNVRGLELVFGRTLGQKISGGSWVMPPADYQRADC